jgi:FxsC-like protein
MSLVFFLSYASNKYLKDLPLRFFQDLIETIGVARPSLKEPIGFLDLDNMKPGDSWTAELGEALQTCRVFVYFRSEEYFGRPWCSKEWGVFNERLRLWMKKDNLSKRPPLVISLSWMPPLPPKPGAPDYDFQIPNEAWNEAYVKNGLKSLMNLTRYDDEYKIFRDKLAQRILEVHDQYELPLGPKNYTLTDAPDAASPAAGSPLEAQPDEPRMGPRFVIFAYVVGTARDLAGEGRRNRDCYGDNGWLDWKPYHPTFGFTIDHYAQGVAYKDGRLAHERINILDHNLVKALRDAEKANKIIVLVVDTWSLKVTNLKEIMTELDREQYLNSGVIIPQNPSDEESQTNKDQLDKLLEGVFRRTRQTERYRDRVNSPDEFEGQVISLINQARKEAFKNVYQEAGTDGENAFRTKPVIAFSDARGVK